MTIEEAEKLIWRWIDEVIIGENFCPFAKSVRKNQQIKLNVIDAKDIDSVLLALNMECKILDHKPEIDTTLVGIKDGFEDFYNYLALVDAANKAFYKEGYDGVYQLASFHPQYLFQGEKEEALSHYTNRSPVPLIHILREESVSRVLQTYKHPEDIPERNIVQTEKLGREFFEKFIPSK